MNDDKCKHFHVERSPFLHGYVIKCTDCGKEVTWSQLKELWR